MSISRNRGKAQVAAVHVRLEKFLSESKRPRPGVAVPRGAGVRRDSGHEARPGSQPTSLFSSGLLVLPSPVRAIGESFKKGNEILYVRRRKCEWGERCIKVGVL